MTAGAARVETLNRRGVSHALIESERVIDMMNVAEGDAKMLLDFPWREREDIGDAIFKTGGELLGNAQEMIDVATLLALPCPAAG